MSVVGLHGGVVGLFIDAHRAGEAIATQAFDDGLAGRVVEQALGNRIFRQLRNGEQVGQEGLAGQRLHHEAHLAEGDDLMISTIRVGHVVLIVCVIQVHIFASVLMM
ncbi:hypothetical protein D3C74_426890 [compost metagenome]